MLCFFLCLCFYTISKAQNEDVTQIKLPADYLSQVSGKLYDLTGKLDKKSSKALSELQKEEDRIKRKLSRLDSSKAKQIFGDAESKYNELKQKIDNPSSFTQYIPYLDTLKTSLKFLENNKALLGKAKDIDKSFSGASGKLKGLESSLSKAEDIKAFIKQRRGYLKEQLGNLPFSKELKKLNKQASIRTHNGWDIIKGCELY